MPSAHRVAWTASAKRDLARLPEKVATAVVEFIYGALADNPRRVGHELHLDLAAHHSARRGDFRVIYRIGEQERRITITVVSHRREVYRRR